MEKSRRELEQRLDRIADDVHPDFERAVSNWVRAQMELETGLELVAQRIAYEQAGDRVRFEACRQEMLKRIDQFRAMLSEQRISAIRRGRPFGSEMSAAYQKLFTTFQHLGG